jgi:hypothetical protein
MTPRAREADLVMREVDGEVLVYDLQRHRAHALNKTSAIVWQHCDGKTGVPELARFVSQCSGAPADERLVWTALTQLGEADLLTDRVTPPLDPGGRSRRAFIRRAGLAAVLAPLVSSIVAPTAAQAASVNQACTPPSENDCNSGICNGANCCCRGVASSPPRGDVNTCCVKNGGICRTTFECCADNTCVAGVCTGGRTGCGSGI